MRWLWRRFESGDVDEPVEVWSELDGARREVRRVELYPNGQMYACGEDFHNAEALSPDPVPEALYTLEAEEARYVSGSVFASIWTAAQERPDALMGL